MRENKGQAGDRVESYPQGSLVYGRFDPRRTDDLKPSATAVIGQLGWFEVLWVIEDGDYVGEAALKLPPDWNADDILWIPERDFKPEVDCTGEVRRHERTLKFRTD